MVGLSVQSPSTDTDRPIEQLEEQKKTKQASKWTATAKTLVTKINYGTRYVTKELHKCQRMSR